MNIQCINTPYMFLRRRQQIFNGNYLVDDQGNAILDSAGRKIALVEEPPFYTPTNLRSIDWTQQIEWDGEAPKFQVFVNGVYNKTTSAKQTVLTLEAGEIYTISVRAVNAAEDEASDFSNEVLMDLREKEASPSFTSGEIYWLNGGRDWPPGTYMIMYVGGGLKYGIGGVSIHERWDPNKGYFLHHSDGNEVEKAPGDGGEYFETQAELELAYEGVNNFFNHTGGKIGLQLVDDPYEDNGIEEGGRPPTFYITKDF